MKLKKIPKKIKKLCKKYGIRLTYKKKGKRVKRLLSELLKLIKKKKQKVKFGNKVTAAFRKHPIAAVGLAAAGLAAAVSVPLTLGADAPAAVAAEGAVATGFAGLAAETAVVGEGAALATGATATAGAATTAGAAATAGTGITGAGLATEGAATGGATFLSRILGKSKGAAKSAATGAKDLTKSAATGAKTLAADTAKGVAGNYATEQVTKQLNCKIRNEKGICIDDEKENTSFGYRKKSISKKQAMKIIKGIIYGKKNNLS
jgi:hypothetical protein